MWMGWVLKSFFFSKKYFNRKLFYFYFLNIYFFSTFFQTPLRLPTCFTLWMLFQFVCLLALHFQSSSNLSSLYTFFYIYIKGTIVEKIDLNFFRELFWSSGVLQPNLRNLTWIHREKSSLLQTCKYFYFILSKYIYLELVGCMPKSTGMEPQCRWRHEPQWWLHHWHIYIYILV